VTAVLATTRPTTSNIGLYRSLGQRPPQPRPQVAALAATRVQRRSILDGLINEYSQQRSQTGLASRTLVRPRWSWPALRRPDSPSGSRRFDRGSRSNGGRVLSTAVRRDENGDVAPTRCGSHPSLTLEGTP
jgi:hypothetical protein